MDNLLKNSNKLQELQELLNDLYSYVLKQLSFNPNIKICLRHSIENAGKSLGLTGYFDIGEKKVILYITGRHIKDILRTFAHEMYHVYQHEKGELTGEEKIYSDKYFQKNEVLRNIEKEAYEKGNILFRDWEESKK